MFSCLWQGRSFLIEVVVSLCVTGRGPLDMHPIGGGGEVLVWFGSRPVPDALAHGQHSPLCRHDWARRIAVVRSQGLPDC